MRRLCAGAAASVHQNIREAISKKGIRNIKRPRNAVGLTNVAAKMKAQEVPGITAYIMIL
jgi:hypothetical protein